MTQIRLRGPWSANLLLAKLISAEDMQPSFNRGRGGCNIDAGIIAVQVRWAAGAEGGMRSPAGVACMPESQALTETRESAGLF